MLGSDDLKIISQRIEIWIKFIWPISLVVTWILLLFLAQKTGVYHEIPTELRQEISGQALGFIQDPFYTIFQFFWIPFIFTMIYAYRFVPKLVFYFVELNAAQTKNVKTGVIIPDGLENIVNKFQRNLMSKWQWYFAVGIAIVAVLLQIYTQFIRIENMHIIYWWDWRFNKTIYLVRLIMVGVDLFFAAIIVYRAACSIIFIERFLGFIQLSPRPHHPDGACGLSIVGNTCVAFTIPLLVIGITLTSSFFLHEETSYLITNLLTLVAYIVSVIFIFYFPLIKVHSVLRKDKEEGLDGISMEINETLVNLEILLKDASNDPEPELRRLGNLQKYYKIIQKMPVWPYDTNALSRFISSILIPTLMFTVSVLT